MAADRARRATSRPSFRAALEAPRDVVHDAAFNIGFSGENYQVRDLAEIVASVVDGSRVVVTGETGADPRSYRVDFSQAAAAFPGLDQEWDARRGAEDLAARFREFGLTAEGPEPLRPPPVAHRAQGGRTALAGTALAGHPGRLTAPPAAAAELTGVRHARIL